MALRSLDNALPITPERPKKLAKLTVPTSKPSDLPLNDENIVPVPVSVDASIDYVPSEDLKPIPDPEYEFQSLIEGLDSKDWMKVCESLNYTRRFALYHSPLLLPILEKVVLVIVKSMKNPRSALIKTSIMAASDVFKAFGAELIESSPSDGFDQLLLQLLLKASQDKRFVCEEAEKSLNVMVVSAPPFPLLHKLRAYVSHGNPKVRAKAAVSFSHCVSKMGLGGMKEFGLVVLVQIAAELLNDRLPEAREAARRTITSTYEAYCGDEEHKNSEMSVKELWEKFKNSEMSVKELWEKFCSESLPAIQAQALIKIVS